ATITGSASDSASAYPCSTSDETLNSSQSTRSAYNASCTSLGITYTPSGPTWDRNVGGGPSGRLAGSTSTSYGPSSPCAVSVTRSPVISVTSCTSGASPGTGPSPNSSSIRDAASVGVVAVPSGSAPAGCGTDNVDIATAATDINPSAARRRWFIAVLLALVGGGATPLPRDGASSGGLGGWLT